MGRLVGCCLQLTQRVCESPLSFLYSLFRGKGRGEWEALVALLLWVQSLEGSRGLLSQDFLPVTTVNPWLSTRGGVGSFLVAGASESWLLNSSIHSISSHEMDLQDGGVSTSLTSSSSCFHLPLRGLLLELASYFHGNSIRDVWRLTLLASFDVPCLLL